jgi:multisubunit Na+/H+ antiporter MnhC subunit
MHNPVNHPLRPLYRVIAALAGLYLIAFGVIGIIVTSGNGLFGQPDERVLGQGANMFWCIVSLIIGAVVLAVTVIGRNLDTEVNKVIGWALVVIGTYELAVSRTDANFLKFTISTVIVTYIVGLALIMAGYYTKVAPPSEVGEPRQVREGRTA